MCRQWELVCLNCRYGTELRMLSDLRHECFSRPSTAPSSLCERCYAQWAHCPIHPPTAPTQLSPAPLLAPLAGAPVTRAVPANDEVLEDDSSEEEDVPVVDDHQVPRNDERWRKIVEVLRPITQLLVRSAFETVHELSFLHGTLWRHSNCYM